MKVTCLLVDDETLALEVIESYLLRLDGFSIIKCNNAVEAFSILQEKNIDIMFLDVQMPKLTGIDLLKILKHKPKTIVTSAYSEYALDGFDLEVVDYLLKPISFERFLKAVAKASLIKPSLLPAIHKEATSKDAFIYLKEEKKMAKIFIRDILFIESIKDYVKVKLVNNKQVITYQRISYLAEKLPEDKFLRVHKSFIVALEKIEFFNHDEITIGIYFIPIGRSYKNRVIDIMNSGNLLR